MDEQANNGPPDGFFEADFLTLSLQHCIDPSLSTVSAWRRRNEKGADAQSAAVLVSLEGEFDHRNKLPLREFVTKIVSSHGSVTLDLSKITFMDSTFISTLIIAAKRAGKLGVRLRLETGSPDSIVSTRLAMTGVTTMFAPDGG
jgi:anti-anti-sigma factor